MEKSDTFPEEIQDSRSDPGRLLENIVSEKKILRLGKDHRNLPNGWKESRLCKLLWPKSSEVCEHRIKLRVTKKLETILFWNAERDTLIRIVRLSSQHFQSFSRFLRTEYFSLSVCVKHNELVLTKG